MPRKFKYNFDTPRDLQRVAYRAIKSRGLCPRCGSNPSPEGRCCAPCLADMATGKQQAREQGMCLDCWKEPALPGKRFCAQHTAYRKEQQRLRYGIRLVRKLCVQCGKKRAVQGMVLCREHLQARRKRQARAKLSQLSNSARITTIE